jgi:hypothetical protein
MWKIIKGAIEILLALPVGQHISGMNTETDRVESVKSAAADCHCG